MPYTTTEALLRSPQPLPADLIHTIAHRIGTTDDPDLWSALLTRPELTAEDALHLFTLRAHDELIADVFVTRPITITHTLQAAQLPLTDWTASVIADGIPDDHVTALLTENTHPAGPALLAASHRTDRFLPALTWLTTRLADDPDTYRELTVTALERALWHGRAEHEVRALLLTVTDPATIRALVDTGADTRHPDVVEHFLKHLDDNTDHQHVAELRRYLRTTPGDPTTIAAAITQLPTDLDWDVFTTLIDVSDPNHDAAAHITAITAAMSAPPANNT